MKQRWSKKQIEDKVNMFKRHTDLNGDPLDEQSLQFFKEKLTVMESKQSKSISIDTKDLFCLHGE